MANSVEKMVKLIFEGDDRVTKVMNSIEGNISKFSSGVENATEPLANLAEKALAAEAALIAMVAGGIVYATNQAGQFNDSFNEISTLIDDTSGNIEIFRQDIIDYGRDASSSYETINGAVYSAISAGVDYQKSLESLDQAEKLSIAGKADLNSTMVLLAGTLNSYGEGIDQAEHYSDVFFKTVKLGQTTIPELAASLSNVTGIASSAGIPIETLASAIAALTAQNIPTSQAMTSLKAAISNIIKPSSEASKVAESLGIQFNAAALQSRGFEGVLNDVYTATGGNVDKMAKLFGSTEALNSVLILAEDKTGKFAGALNDMANAAGSTEAAYQKMADNMKLINQNLINNIEATLIQFGSKFLDEWQDIAGAVGDIFEGVSIGMNQGAFDPIIDMIEAFGQDVAGYLQKVAAAMPEALNQVEFKELVDSFESLGGAVRDTFEAFFGHIDLTTPKGLADAIQKIVNAVKALNNVSSGILQGLEPFFAGLGKMVDEAGKADSSTTELTGRIFGLADGINKVTGALNVLGPALDAFLISGALKNVATLLGAFGVSLGSLATLGVPIAIAGTATAIGLIIDKVQKFYYEKKRLQEQPKEIETKLILDDGNILDLIDGIIRDAEGNVISVPIVFETDEEAAERSAMEATEKVKQALLDGTPDVIVNYMADPSVENLKAALGKSGALVVKPEIDQRATDRAVEIVEQITGEKTLDIELKGEIDERLKRVETEAAKVQTAIEWEAKLDIAQVESGTRRIVAAMESASTVVTSTGSAIESLFGTLADVDSRNTRSVIERQIREESEMRKEAHDKNMALLDVQLKLEQERLKRSQSGQSLYTIEAANLQPYLEAIWVEVVDAIQIRANEEGLENLIGL